MKLIRYGEPGVEKPGIQLDDGTRFDASALTRDYDEAFLSSGGLDELRRWLEAGASSGSRLDRDVRLGPPIARPSKIICIGLNYRDHAAESGMDLPKEPVIFFKSTTALTGPDDDVIIPKGGSKLDWEVELAVVVGRVTRHVAPDRAFAAIAGYALHNDYSERVFQLERGGQWVKGKSADTFAPLGPFLATCDEIPDPHALAMWLDVNGTPRQRSTTTNMIFEVAALVSYVSEFMTLLPGDVISTGTPAGVALGMKPEPQYLRAGDVVRLGIDRLGEATQRIVSYRTPD
jgi:2-keto-4-pentenoate hydratase/2-oxohepta-3-ene-1,7-dioic acid hydratase in catechol pathway